NPATAHPSGTELRSIAYNGYIIAVPVGQKRMIPRAAICEFVDRYEQSSSNDDPEGRRYRLPFNDRPYPHDRSFFASPNTSRRKRLAAPRNRRKSDRRKEVLSNANDN